MTREMVFQVVASTSSATQWLTGLLSFWSEKYPDVDVIELCPVAVVHGSAR